MTDLREFAARHNMPLAIEEYTPRSARRPSFMREVVAPVIVFASTTGAAVGGARLVMVTWGGALDFAASLAICAGGVAGFVAAWIALPHYWELQWTEKLQRIEPRPVEVKPPPVYLPRKTGWASIPADVRDDRLTRFCRAALRDDILTQAGAGRFGFNRSEWETLRDWCIKQRLLEWKAPDNHKLGVRFASGGRAGFETIASKEMT